MSLSKRSRGFTFTINNYTDDTFRMLSLLEAKYVIYGKEIAPSTGTPHLQGYVHFENAKTLRSTIKKLPGAHVEVRQGTLEQAINYCKKENNYTEFGTAPLSQEQKGLLGKEVYQEAWDLAKQGRIEDVKPKIRLVYYSTLKQICKDFHVESLPSNQILSNEWYFGPSGTGKSRQARSKYPGAYIKNLNKWWDGYAGEETVIIDEWSPNQECLSSYLKIWSDHYPFRAEVKGSSMMIRPVRIIVTSNYSIDDCFKNLSDSAPIHRRFNVIEFSHRGGYMESSLMHSSQ